MFASEYSSSRSPSLPDLNSSISRRSSAISASAARSIIDHVRIIEALERRDPELAERLAREHTLGLAAHVEQHGGFLDVGRDDV